MNIFPKAFLMAIGLMILFLIAANILLKDV